MPGPARPGPRHPQPVPWRYRVSLTVARRGGMLQWGAVRGNFDQRLAAQENPALRYPHIETETRRGKDQVTVTVLMTVHAPEVAQALTAAWDAFQQAAGDDTAGWDIASATAHVWPEA